MEEAAEKYWEDEYPENLMIFPELDYTPKATVSMLKPVPMQSKSEE